ncbi:hypothetical protein THAOC_25646, partial [Thalassiosira oceanica]
AMGAVIGPPGEAMEELDSPYHRFCAVVPVEPTGCSVTGRYRHEDVAQGRWEQKVLKALLVLIQISNYHKNKTRLAEAASGPDGDDNEPGSEPPPHDCFRYVSTFTPSRRRSQAAVGKPSFPRFKVYYLPRRRVRFEPRPLDFPDLLLHDKRTYGRSEDHG